MRHDIHPSDDLSGDTANGHARPTAAAAEDGETTQPLESATTRRRFMRQVAGVGLGGAALLVLSRSTATADEKSDRDAKNGPKDNASATPTPRATATPPAPARDDEAPETTGEEIIGTRRNGEADRRRPHPARPAKRRKYLRIDHANAGIGQTVLTSPDPDATFVVQNAAGAAVVGETTGALGAFNSVGVKGLSTSGIGVEGESTDSTGVFGGSQRHYGVHGTSDRSVGVLGETSAIDWAIIGRAHGPAAGGVSGTTPNRGKGVEGLSGFGEPGGPPGPPPDPSTFPVIGVFGAAKSPDGFAKGVLGVTHDAQGRGVAGEAPFGGVGVHGFSTTGSGVVGISQQRFGVEAFSDTSVGLLAGTGGADWAIIGRAAANSIGGISGFAPKSVGVEGVTDGIDGAGVGVRAINHYRDAASHVLAGRALEVVGRAVFSSARRVGFAPGATVVTATGVDGALPGALVIATVQTGGAGAAISHALVTAPGTVEVHLTAPTAAAGEVGFLVMN